jgi:type IV fimbrial biogenesis protein FimT
MGGSIRAALRPAMRISANAAYLERGADGHAPQNPHMQRRKGSPGVTLIELCFGLAVVGILAGLAVPSLRSALRAAAVRSASLELLAALQQARASSIVAGRPGVFCLSDGAGHCLSGDAPALAWNAFLAGTGSPVPLAGSLLPRGIELRATRPTLTFQPDALAASTGTLTICDRQGVARPRAIVLSQGGRVRLADADPAVCQA